MSERELHFVTDEEGYDWCREHGHIIVSANPKDSGKKSLSPALFSAIFLLWFAYPSRKHRDTSPPP